LVIYSTYELARILLFYFLVELLLRMGEVRHWGHEFRLLG